MPVMLHCICKDCGKRFMQFEHKDVKCPDCGSKNYEVKDKADKDVY